MGSVLECLEVTKSYGNVLAINNISLNLRPGEILSILGPSGCGKTTLLRLIAGFENLDHGEINIQGRKMSDASRHVPPEDRDVGMVFQEYALFPHMTVAQNISFGLRKMSRPEKQQRLKEVVNLVRIAGLENRYPHELSGGQQQRVALARTLAPRPVTMLLDEPFSNLDSQMRVEMRQEVEGILKSNNIATVFVTHDREEAFAISDRIAVMNEGKIDQMDAPESIYEFPRTAFVSQMTGICDFLSGMLIEGNAVTAIGKFQYITEDGVSGEGGLIDLLVRPEDFRVILDHNGTSEVQTREFRGDETMLVVRIPSGETLRCRERSYSALIPGSKVSLISTREGRFVGFKRPNPI